METLLWIAAIPGAFYFAKLTQEILVAGKARVKVDQIGLADFILCSFLLLFFGGIIILSWGAGGEKSGPSQLTASQLIPVMVFWIGIAASIVISLVSRGISVVDHFALRQRTLSKSLLSSAILVALTLPLVLAFQQLTGSTEEQSSVQLLRNTPDWTARALLIANAVLIAPIMEEVIFRGFLYPVLKKYGGIAGALALSSTVFAAIHLHLPVFLPLLVFALCLAIAYEITGTLMVPICMHMIFNAVNIIVLFSGLADRTQ